jgi:Ca2+-binding RTX toxin-like protein
VNIILAVASEVANRSAQNGHDNLDSVRTLLAATPANLGLAAQQNLYTLLNNIEVNQINPQVTDTELASTIKSFMVRYEGVTATHTLEDVILHAPSTGHYTIAEAVIDNLSSAHFTTIAADSAIASSTIKMLTTGADVFNGTTTPKTAVFGGAGNDTIDYSKATSAIAKFLDGGSGNDILRGANGSSDILHGGSGNDKLNGGGGKDTLTGGTGADVFIFNNISSIDHVTDFNKAQGDKIDLHDVLSFDSALGDAITDFVSMRQVGANTVLSVDTDGKAGGTAWHDVSILDNSSNLNVLDLFAHGQIIA